MRLTMLSLARVMEGAPDMSILPTGLARRPNIARLCVSVRPRPRLITTLLIWAAVAVLIAFVSQRASAQTCSTTIWPYTLTNGATADASQVMADLNCAAVHGLANWSGNVGIGTTSPAAPLDIGGGGYLHVSGAVNPAVTSQGAYFSWNATGGIGEADFINNRGGGLGGFYFVNSTALTTPLMFIAASGNVGIGNASPSYNLDVSGVIRSLNTSPNVGQNDMILLGSGASSYNEAILDYNYVSSGSPSNSIGIGFFAANNQLVVQANGNVGIGNKNPSAKLSVGTSALGGSSASTTLNTFSGNLSSSSGIDLTLASIGFGSNNQSSLGIHAYRVSSGSDWTTTSIGLGMDVDNSTRVNNSGLWLYSNGNVGIGTVSPPYTLYVNGQAGGATSWANASDARLKKNIVEITGALQLVQKLRGVRFDWRRPKERTVGKTLRLPLGEHEMGFVAQEVAKVVPEAVASPKTGKDRLYGVKEADLVPLLVQAIKEQQEEIAKLQSVVAALQQTISKQGH